MSQILSGVQFCHEKKIYFDIGQLNEFNIYLSETLDRCMIDTGFFYDEEIEIPRQYVEDEFGEEKTIKSPEQDIFSLGMLFFRLITLLSSDEIEDLFEKEVKQVQKKKDPKKRRSVGTGLFNAIFSFAETTEKPLKYISNFRYELFKHDKGYNEDLLVLVLDMLNPIELQRPTASKILSTLQSIKQKAIARPSFMQNDTTLKRITEGWTFEQTSCMTDILYRQFVKEFLRLEFCVETLLFFEDITTFKELKGTKRIEKSNEIILSYLSTRKSTLQVNVNSKQIKNISSTMKLQLETTGGLEDNLFDDALGHVINTMMCDNYPRFDKTKIYEKLQKVRMGEKTSSFVDKKKKKSFFSK
jgi:serine/threonine protein kinase